MSTVLLCPACRSAQEYRNSGTRFCSQCGGEFPAQLSVLAMAVTRRQRPLLLTLLMGFLAFFASVGGLIALTALLGNGPFTINGEPVTKGVFVRNGLLPLLPFVLAAAALVHGLWRGRRWVRPTLLAFYAAAGFGPAIYLLWRQGYTAGMGTGLFGSAIFVGLIAWYLYGKRSVVSYYEALRPPEASQPGPMEDDSDRAR